MSNSVLGGAGRTTAPALAVFALLTASCTSSGGPSYDALRSDAELARPRVADTVGDDRALKADALDRAAFVRAVLHRNPSIEEARFAWRSAVARVRQAGALPDPAVSLGIAPLSVASSSTPVGYDVGVSQRLPWPGKLAFEESAAKANALAAQSDFEVTRRELALSAALLYDEYFVAARSIETNGEHIALMKDLKGAALAQLESGRGSVQDPLEAEVELTHMEHDAILLASDRDVAVAQMNELLHRDPNAPLPPPTNLPTSEDVDASAAVHLEIEAVLHRPEIEAARERARAEEARGRRAERDSYPDVTVSTSYSSMWAMPEHRWMVGLGLDLPIQLGRRAGAVDEANAEHARFESEVARLSDKARTEVAVALKRREEAEHVARLYKERLIPVARAQIAAARAGFVSSRNDFVAVVGAERNLRGVELAYQMALADLDRRGAELDRALGRIPGIDGSEGPR